MARNHARIFVSVWQDPDWCSLSPDAQRLFFLILSQPKLTNIGVIDYRPAKWARCSAATTTKDVEKAVAELEERNYVIVDRDTEELLVRTFVKNDGMCQRWQMVSAMWSAWELVESLMLRRYVLDWLPDEAWTAEKAPPPLEAEQLRDSEPIAIEVASDCEPIETPNSLLLSPTPTPAPVASPVATLDGFDDFWDAYPARNGKKLEKHKAQAVWRGLTASKRDAAMVGVRHYSVACDVGDAMAKDAFRWLRDGSWVDWQEPPARRANVPKGAGALMRAAERGRVIEI